MKFGKCWQLFEQWIITRNAGRFCLGFAIIVVGWLVLRGSFGWLFGWVFWLHSYSMKTLAEPAQGLQTQWYHFHKLRQSLGKVLIHINSCHLSTNWLKIGYSLHTEHLASWAEMIRLFGFHFYNNLVPVQLCLYLMPGIGIWAPEFTLPMLYVQELALQFGWLLGDSRRDAQWHKSHLSLLLGK